MGPRESQPSVQRALLPMLRRSLGLGASVFAVRVRSGRSCTKQRPGSENTPSSFCSARVASALPADDRFLRRPWAQAELELPLSWLPRDQSRRSAVQSLGMGLPARLVCHLQCSTPPTLGPWGLAAPGTVPVPGDLKGTADLPRTLPRPPPTLSTGPLCPLLRTRPWCGPHLVLPATSCSYMCVWHICKNQEISCKSTPWENGQTRGQDGHALKIAGQQTWGPPTMSSFLLMPRSRVSHGSLQSRGSWAPVVTWDSGQAGARPTGTLSAHVSHLWATPGAAPGWQAQPLCCMVSVLGGSSGAPALMGSSGQCQAQESALTAVYIRIGGGEYMEMMSTLVGRWAYP